MTDAARVAALQTMLREVRRELDRLLAGPSSMPDAIEVLAWIENGLSWQLRDPTQYVAAHGGAPIDAEVTRGIAEAIRAIGEVNPPDVALVPSDVPLGVLRVLQRWGDATADEREMVARWREAALAARDEEL